MKTGKHNPNFKKDYQDLVEAQTKTLINNAGDLGLKQTERLKQLQNVKPKWV